MEHHCGSDGREIYGGGLPVSVAHPFGHASTLLGYINLQCMSSWPSRTFLSFQSLPLTPFEPPGSPSRFSLSACYFLLFGMPFDWTAERERLMLLMAIQQANLKPTKQLWSSVATSLGGGLTPSAVRCDYPDSTAATRSFPAMSPPLSSSTPCVFCQNFDSGSLPY
jgi:hypothetical protein